MNLQSIWKYPLNAEVNRIKMPMAAEILCVQMQHSKPTLWAMVIPSDDKQIRTIEIIPTGSLFQQENRKYIGTVQLEDGFLIYHVFEKFE